jgi:hypothetical protein
MEIITAVRLAATALALLPTQSPFGRLPGERASCFSADSGFGPLPQRKPPTFQAAWVLPAQGLGARKAS